MSNLISNKQQIELFCKDITDFMVLHASSHLGMGKELISNESMEDCWQQLTEDYKAIQSKSPHVKDIWKQLSSIMSKHFFTKKMINAEQVAFNTNQQIQTP